MELGGLTAIVTGGASGLGEATARKLAENGVKVGIFDLNEERGTSVAREIGGAFAKVDVTSGSDVDAAFEKVRTALGQERILVNCAGIADPAKTVGRDRKTGAIKQASLARFEKIIQVNLLGTYRCIVKSAAGMLTLDPVNGERGAIVNTASVAAVDGQVGQASYSASKGGIVGLTLPVARDLAPELIRVNTILPGIFATPIMKILPQDIQDSLAAQVPNPSRLGNPDEYASLALEMCKNGYFNGECVRLDGAIRMAPR